MTDVKPQLIQDKDISGHPGIPCRHHYLGLSERRKEAGKAQNDNKRSKKLKCSTRLEKGKKGNMKAGWLDL